jgi:hypothetical protein
MPLGRVVWRADHPHGCGEHDAADTAAEVTVRIIPTGVGNTIGWGC